MIFNILFSCIIWSVVILSIIRFLPVIGINIFNRIPPGTLRSGEKPRREVMAKIFISALIFRFLVYIIGAAAVILMQKANGFTFDTFLDCSISFVL